MASTPREDAAEEPVQQPAEGGRDEVDDALRRRAAESATQHQGEDPQGADQGAGRGADQGGGEQGGGRGS